MVKMYGKVTVSRGTSDYSPPEESEDPMKSCINYCYERQECILASFDMASGKCQYYDYTSSYTPVTVKNMTEDSGMYVAIKTNSDTCPATFEEVSLSFMTPDEKTLYWTTVESGGFEFSGCESMFQRFDRPSGSSFCVSTPKSYEPTKEEAKTRCERLELVILGVELKEEAERISEQIIKLFSVGSFSMAQKEDFAEPGPFNYWLDGERVGGGVTDFTYTDGMTVGNDVLTTSGIFSYDENEVQNVPRCLVLVASRNATVKIIDVSCDTYNSVDGVVCAYKLE